MQTSIYLIPTTVLFDTLNTTRQNRGLMKIENSLIARKLGILLAFKADDCINFKNEYIKLNENQLVSLQEIISYYFDVDMNDELRAIAVKQEQESLVTNIRHNKPSPPDNNQGLMSKIKGFFKNSENRTVIHEALRSVNGKTSVPPISTLPLLSGA